MPEVVVGGFGDIFDVSVLVFGVFADSEEELVAKDFDEPAFGVLAIKGVPVFKDDADCFANEVFGFGCVVGELVGDSVEEFEMLFKGSSGGSFFCY